MFKLELRHVSKIYPQKVIAVDDFNLEIIDQEFVALLGPSGCGKTSLLRMIAGLEEISQGEIMISGQCVNRLESARRDVSMVFQGNSLFPTMNVFDNMSFGLRKKKVNQQEIESRINQVAKNLELEDYLLRLPSTLSTGQKQRVALGRAIVHQSKVILMDEPLSNLDQKLRAQMRFEIKKLHQDLKATTLYVTHDMVEAMTMADRVVVMFQGKIQQIGSPEELYKNPLNLYVAQTMNLDSINFIKVKKEWLINHFGLNNLLEADHYIMGIRSDSFNTQNNQNRITIELKVAHFEYLAQYQIIYGTFLDQEIQVKWESSLRLENRSTMLFYVEVTDIYLFDSHTMGRVSINQSKGAIE